MQDKWRKSKKLKPKMKGTERKLAKRSYDFYKDIKGTSANTKLLSWLTRNYSTHIDQIIKYDIHNPSEKSMLELFNNSIKDHLPTLHTRVMNLALDRENFFNSLQVGV